MMRRILVVDDEQDIAMSLKAGLERKGFAVDVFFDPLEALERYQPGTYDLLIIDVRMPKMNGFELCAKSERKTPLRWSGL